MIYLISQIFALSAFIFALFGYHKKTKSKILINMEICHLLNIVHYILLNAYSGCITKIIAMLRDGFILLKEQNKKLSNIIFLIIFLFLYLVVAIFTYKGILSIFPLIAAVIYMCIIWYGNELQVKKAAFLCYFLWLGYNIYVFSIVGIISNSISIISTFIAIINYKKLKNKDYM